MRSFLPWRKVDYALNITPSRLLTLLRREIGEGDGNQASTREENLSYLGEVDEEKFVITRINLYRSSYMPHIMGRLQATSSGVDVAITMRLHRQVRIFSSIWLFFLFLFFLLVLFLAPRDSSWLILLSALPPGLAIASWMLTIRVFESDCHWALKSLEENIFSRLGEWS